MDPVVAAALISAIGIIGAAIIGVIGWWMRRNGRRNGSGPSNPYSCPFIPQESTVKELIGAMRAREGFITDMLGSLNTQSGSIQFLGEQIKGLVERFDRFLERDHRP